MASSRKPPRTDLAAALAAFLDRHAISGRVCVGLSGGVDSVVLLHLLERARHARGFALLACHVNHGLSPNAAHWQRFCEALCARLGVPLELARVEVARAGRGLEAAAREARRRVFGALSADWIALGHHLDDQAETVLFRLLRGCGVRGAAGIAACEPGAAGPGRMRPLLGVARASIEAWARAENLAWVEDESNQDTALTRNFLRGRALPVLRERFPAAPARLAEAAAHFAEAQRLLDQLAAGQWRRIGDALSVAQPEFCRLDEAARRNLLRWRLQALGLEMPDAAVLTEGVRQAGAVAPSRPLRFRLGRAWLCGYRGRLWVEPDWPGPVQDVALPQAGEIDWAGGRLALLPACGEGLDRGALPAGARLGARREGDRLRLAPGGAARSLKSLFQEAGVPPWVRGRLPVLRLGERVLWCAELGADASCRCASGAPGLMPVWAPPAGVLTRLPARC